MGRYLREFHDQYTWNDSTRHTIKALAEKFKVIITGHHYDDQMINSSIKIREPNGRFQFFLNEFPGNCSFLIANATFFFDTAKVEEPLAISEEICKSLDYRALIISSPNQKIKERLMKEYGFQVMVEDVFNPRSGSKNYILIKHISPDGEKEKNDDKTRRTETRENPQVPGVPA